MFGIYVHWPFCAQKCPYCDFNSHVRFSGWDEERFLAAYLRELDWVAAFRDAPSGRLAAGADAGGHPKHQEVRESEGATRLPSAPSGRLAAGADAGGHPKHQEVRESEGATRLPSAPSGRLAARESEGATKNVTSIFFGGGTPSLMKPQTVGAILDHIAKLWPVGTDAEITLEANPGSVEAGRFKGYRAAGINRVSMGLQSLRDEELKKLGRIHTVAEAKAALEIARSTFERYSFDLIYARPGQAPQQWREELREALTLANDHISLYQLTIEPDTPFAALRAAGKLIVPDPDAAAALYEITQEMTAARGMAAYEISNHAKPGAESRHNLLYWRYGEYAGVGPGAHGRLLATKTPSGRLAERESEGATKTPSGRLAERESEGATQKRRIATVAERHPETWAARVETEGHGYTETMPLDPEQQADEMLLMGLRLSEGIDLDALARLGGVRPSDKMIRDLEQLGLLEHFKDPPGTARNTSPAPPSYRQRNELDEIEMCLGPGMAPEHPLRPGIGDNSRKPNRIRATPRGRFVLNALVAKLSESFQDVAASPAMDIDAPSH